MSTTADMIAKPLPNPYLLRIPNASASLDTAMPLPAALSRHRIGTPLLAAILLAWPASGCRTPTNDRTVDELFAAYDGPDRPGAAVLVLLNGRPVLEATFGASDLEHRTPVTPSTNFRLASVTKQFTAAAILQLAERNALSLDALLTDFFPHLPLYAGSISVRNLLTHTSGLLDYEDLIADTATVQLLDRDVLALMADVDSTYFPPGSRYRYSNSGYAVLACIVETVSGRRFAEYLEERIFLPAGMNSTVAYEKGRSQVPDRAYGYAPEGLGFVFADQSITSAVLGDGGVYSSIRDLARWDQALHEETVLNAASIRLATSPAVAIEPDSSYYGFGWRLDRFRGHRRMHHTGSTSGFRNVIQRYPDARTTVVILTNRAEPDVASLANRLAERYLPDRPN